MHRLSRVLVSLTVIMPGLILLLILVNPHRINCDTSMYIEVGNRLLEGQKPYVDYYEINFPLIHYLGVIPAGAARLLPVHEITAALVMVWLLTVWSVWAGYRASGDYFQEASFARLLVPFATGLHSLYQVFNNDFAQREHLFMLLYVPVLLVRLNRWENRVSLGQRSAFLYGLLAGIGLCIKPHFVLAAAAVEGYWLWQQRDWRKLFQSETWGILCVGMAYAASFILLPDVTAGLIENLKLVNAGYGAYEEISIAQMVIQSPALQISFLLCMLPWMPWPRLGSSLSRRPGFPRLSALARALSPASRCLTAARLFALFGFVGMAIYLVQAKGFRYHGMIFTGGALIATMFLMAHWAVSTGFHAGRGQTLARLALAAGAFTVLTMALTWNQIIYHESPFQRTVMAHSREGDAILVLSPMLHQGLNYPELQQIDRRPAGSYVVAYPYLMGNYHLSNDEIFDPGVPPPASVQRFLDLTAEDIRTGQPRLIVVDKNNNNLYRYLALRGFIQNEILPHYTVLDESEHYVIFQSRSE